MKQKSIGLRYTVVVPFKAVDGFETLLQQLECEVLGRALAEDEASIKRKRRRVLSPEQKAEVRAMMADGAHPLEVARQYAVDVSTVRRLVRS